MTTTHAIGRISGNLSELKTWAKQKIGKSKAEAHFSPLGKDRWQVVIELPRPTEIGAKRRRTEP